MSKRRTLNDPAREARDAAIASILDHPVLAPLARQVSIRPDVGHSYVAEAAWLTVSPRGAVY
ncbi:hypothetical protein, partial [Methylomagnum sp.]